MKIFNFIYWFRFEITTFIITGLALICGKDWRYFWIGCVTFGIGEILRRIYLLELKLSINHSIQNISTNLDDSSKVLKEYLNKIEKNRINQDIND